MDAVKKLLASVPPMAVAVWAFQHLNAEVAPFMNPILEACNVDLRGESNPLLKFVSSLNCFIVPFFAAVVRSKAGAFVWANFCALGAAFGGFSALESSRLGARFPLSLHWLYTFIFMFIGISIGMPLLWTPAYFFLGSPSTFKQAHNLKLSWPRVWTICAFNAIFYVTGIATLVSWSNHGSLDLAIKFAIWAPIILPLAWLLVPVTRKSQAEQGQEAASFMHCFNAGLCIATHAGVLLSLVASPSIIADLHQTLFEHPGGLACIYFLLVDLFIFWVACIHLVLIESGFVPALLVVLGTPLLGLGAPLCFYYMKREAQILDRINTEQAVEAKKKGT